VSQCVAVCCSVCCSVLQCVAMCYSVSQCVAVCCSVVQCVAVCCSGISSRYMLPESIRRNHFYKTSGPVTSYVTEWRKFIGYLKLQVSFRKRVANIGLFWGKQPTNIRYPMGLRHLALLEASQFWRILPRPLAPNDLSPTSTTRKRLFGMQKRPIQRWKKPIQRLKRHIQRWKRPTQKLKRPIQKPIPKN